MWGKGWGCQRMRCSEVVVITCKEAVYAHNWRGEMKWGKQLGYATDPTDAM